MNIAALLLCEGIVTDGRGAHVLVGANMNIRHVPKFPAVIAAHAYVLIEDDGEDLAPGTKTLIRVTVTAPDGNTNRVARGEVEIGEAIYPDLPGNIQLALPINFEADEPGTYTLECEVTTGEASVSRSTKMHVRPAPESG